MYKPKKYKNKEWRLSQLFLARKLVLSHFMVMWASFQDHRKNSSDNLACYKYNLSSPVVSAAALNEYRRVW